MNMENGCGESESVKITSDATSDVLLSEHVRIAVERYFKQINGHPVCGLYDMVLCEVELPLIKAVLVQCRHNQTAAAKALGMSRSTLRKKMTQYSLE